MRRHKVWQVETGAKEQDFLSRRAEQEQGQKREPAWTNSWHVRVKWIKLAYRTHWQTGRLRRPDRKKLFQLQVAL